MFHASKSSMHIEIVSLQQHELAYVARRHSLDPPWRTDHRLSCRSSLQPAWPWSLQHSLEYKVGHQWSFSCTHYAKLANLKCLYPRVPYPGVSTTTHHKERLVIESINKGVLYKSYWEGISSWSDWGSSPIFSQLMRHESCIHVSIRLLSYVKHVSYISTWDSLPGTWTSPVLGHGILSHTIFSNISLWNIEYSWWWFLCMVLPLPSTYDSADHIRLGWMYRIRGIPVDGQEHKKESNQWFPAITRFSSLYLQWVSWGSVNTVPYPGVFNYNTS